jgi:hypothetical protein
MLRLQEAEPARARLGFRRTALVLSILASASCGDPERQPGICELLSASVRAMTAEGSAPIARVEVSSPCMRAGCLPASFPDGSAGDGSAESCTYVSIVALSAGRCQLAFFSKDGARVEASVEVRRLVTGSSCTDDIGRVHRNIPALVAEPSSLTVNLGPARPDAGAD